MTLARATSCLQRKGGACGREFLDDRLQVLLGVQPAILADGVLEHEIEDRLARVTEFAVVMCGGGGEALIVLADGRFGDLQQARRLVGLDFVAMFVVRVGLASDSLVRAVFGSVVGERRGARRWCSAGW